ncbi:hypothetical protein [Actinoplanes xinjiangensis]|uniref:MFS transporter n=1 Tax=Actinoplanes xinjiangensis TaxID=512350 RepID=A0A316FV28_9ACTN|nr:hypothetical protein [Actinoplanes xinjiangensis]PWK45251.1 hypothetical protein BC793_111225 [Actinoplanes xinjiangensis]
MCNRRRPERAYCWPPAAGSTILACGLLSVGSAGSAGTVLAAVGMTPLQAGLATLPAAAAMIAATPLITPLAVRIGPGRRS